MKPATALALAEGLWVRHRIEVLPPAGGPSTGQTAGTPDAAALTLGVLGESTAAGCGVDSHEAGFTGALARALAGPARAPIAWRVVGEHGATARRIRHRLMPRLPEDHDLVVLLAGANDVLSRRTPAQWESDLTAIVTDLTARAHSVVVTGVPPFAAFPSLPRTLARYLAARGQELDAVSRAVCGVVPDVGFVETPPDLVGPGFFARDGFHPSARGYQEWAALVAASAAPRHSPRL